MSHGLYGGRVFRRRRGGSEAFAQGGMMGLPAEGDQRLNPCRGAGRHIGRAKIAVIGQQRFRRAQRLGQSLPSRKRGAAIWLTIGARCCLSLAAWTTSVATTSRRPAATAACAL
jgi:hypothetical protein